MQYRIMVEGEDHKMFCYEDDIYERVLMDRLKDAQQDYPCGRVWIEEDSLCD